MKKPTVYLETTIAGYLAGRRSRDIVVLAHQELTHIWWENHSSRFRLYTSEIVLQEAQMGDIDAAARRMSYLAGIPLIAVNEKVRELAVLYMTELGFPKKALIDALHLAISVHSAMDYLLTWNCTHLANEIFQRRLVKTNNSLSHHTPLIVTPENLIQEEGRGIEC
ncbi:MAG: type II toxin-antitoxin system VapC family toxin [Candidatus Eremiobacteraeota bacterium]|nr:type II toxin-antitoxin system VapC family toxin [Candidatus Eremiobacteraeota bacterium]